MWNIAMKLRRHTKISGTPSEISDVTRSSVRWIGISVVLLIAGGLACTLFNPQAGEKLWYVLSPLISVGLGRLFVCQPLTRGRG